MAFFTIQRNGFATVSDMINSVIVDMVNHGFTVAFPSSYNISAANTAPYKVILTAGPDVDPLSTLQPWRVCFDVQGPETCAVYVATPLQLKDDGTVSPINDSTGKLVYLAGSTGQPLDKVDVDIPTTGFLNRSKRVGSNSTAFPLNYRLTISSHGFFLGAFEGAWASVIYQSSINSYFNWLLVQRPVDKVTGNPLITGKSPLFCVNKVDSKYWKFVVRESDIPHPTNPVAANSHSEDSFRIINTQNQISVTEDKKYLVSFMNNLNTSRFRYTEELDLVGIVSADIIMDSVPTQISVYGANRIYSAMPGSGGFNTGVKLLALTSIS